MEVTHNKTINRPEWDLLSGSGWENGKIGEVVAARFGPDGVYVGKACEQWDNPGVTELTVEFVAPGRQHRIIEKYVDARLSHLTEASLTSHWGRMISAALDWPNGKKWKHGKRGL